jgi:preprotein translocase subunit SecD
MVFRKEENRIMGKLNWKIWLLIFAVLGSLLAIVPLDFTKGIEINSVEQNSTAFNQGVQQGQIITHVEGELVTSIDEFNEIINSKFPSEEKQKLTITTKSGEFSLFDNQAPEISVKDIEKTRIKTGLDLSGGARALVVAEGHDLSVSELNDLIDITNERLNVYGLKDVIVKPQSDLFGKNKMLIEIAGSTPKELENLISQQGKFEAKIGNETVFIGGEKDITYIARSGEQSGIYDCGTYQEGIACQFRFGITISPEAAKRFSEITNELGIDPENPGSLDQKIDLYLDDELYSSLSISKDLKGSETTQISISGSGTGSTNQEALENTQNEMKQLQTVLKTGSLPFKLEIEKLDTISPLLGQKFIRTIFITGLSVIFAVGLIVLLRYRKFKLSFAVLLTSLSEVMIILGISALFRVNLDLPAIAGIIAAIGTGVDSQIIILDESQMSQILSLKQRIKNALFIILGTYFTTLFALSPLYWAGGGLLKGFVITTIIGISAGVLITRPAFSEIVKRILKD